MVHPSLEDGLAFSKMSVFVWPPRRPVPDIAIPCTVCSSSLAFPWPRQCCHPKRSQSWPSLSEITMLVEETMRLKKQYRRVLALLALFQRSCTSPARRAGRVENRHLSVPTNCLHIVLLDNASGSLRAKILLKHAMSALQGVLAVPC